jgi:hypothetical protein
MRTFAGLPGCWARAARPAQGCSVLGRVEPHRADWHSHIVQRQSVLRTAAPDMVGVACAAPPSVAHARKRRAHGTTGNPAPGPERWGPPQPTTATRCCPPPPTAVHSHDRPPPGHGQDIESHVETDDEVEHRGGHPQGRQGAGAHLKGAG